MIRRWYENGQLKSESERVFGCGVSDKEWDEAGNLIREWHISPDDKDYDLIMRRKQTHENSDNP